MKVVHEMGQAGFLETIGGRGGGIRLARAPEDIGIGDVVRHAEGEMVLVECFNLDTNHCRIQPVCGLRPIFDEALGAFMATLDRYSLADLVSRRRSPLSQILAL